MLSEKLKENIMCESEKWVEYQTYNIKNRVIFDNGEEDFIIIPVVASGNYKAMRLAKDWLLSRKAFLVKEVQGQWQVNDIRPTPTGSVLIEV